jgi:secreted PhoX family phosphatase
MQIIVLGKDYSPIPLITLHGQDLSEITGPAFSPDGSRLYFSSQRGIEGKSESGITYELLLPNAFSFS